MLSEEAKVAFICVGKKSGKGPGTLLASGQSVWVASSGDCHLEPKLMPLNILVTVPNLGTVVVSDLAPLAN